MAGTRKQRVKRYSIHDNGGRPFFVEVKGRSVTVLKNMDSYESPKSEPPKPLFAVGADEIFIGKKSPNGGYDGLRPSQAIGNSILLRTGSKYIYIGSEIYEFAPIKGDTIETFYSNIGHSDVPYPYAIGKTHVYIFLDKVAVEKSYFDMAGDIYKQYYYDKDIHMCLFGNPKSDICKDPSVYKPKLAEFKKKKVSLKTKLLQKRDW